MKSEPIRILQVLAGMNRGGAEAFIMNVYRHIDKSKIQFDFVLFRKEECDFNEEIRNLGGKIYYIPRYNGKNHFSYKKAWNNFFKEHSDYKIIHGHVRSTAAIYLKIAKKYGLITIIHSHSTSSRGSKVEQFTKNLLQFPIRYIADYFFACSNKAGIWLFGEKTIKKDNYRVINNAIDVDKYKFDSNIRNKVRTELKLENKLILGHVGTFTPPKNHEFLIDVFNEVHKQNNNTILLLIGDGELRHSMEKKVKNLGLEKDVIFTGIRKDVPHLLQAMDAFLFPSIFEGLPVTLIEVQASGLQCFVSDNITKEVKVSNNIHFISLNCPIKTWSNEILKSQSNTRNSDIEEIIQKGYEIKKEITTLENFFLNL